MLNNWVENVEKLGFQVSTIDCDIIEITEDNGQWVAGLTVDNGVYSNESEGYYGLDNETQTKLNKLLHTFCNFSYSEREKIFKSLVRLPKFKEGMHWATDKLLELGEGLSLDLTKLDDFITALSTLCDDEYNVGYNDCKDDYSRYAQNVQKEMKEKIVENLNSGLDDLKDF